MNFRNRYDGVDEFAVRFIRIKAHQLLGRFGFSVSDREDLEQDLMLDLLHRLPNYHPERAKLNTFIARVIDHRIATIIEAQEAGIRDYRLCTCSLNDVLENDKGGLIERLDTFDQDEYLIRTGRLSRTATELHELLIDLDRLIRALPLDLRGLCRRLGADTITEISRDTGIPRSTIYDMVKKIRAILKSAGLEDYLAC